MISTLRKSSILSLLLILGLACTSPTKDFNIHISPTFFKYVVEVELSDFNNPGVTFTDPVTIDVVGPDADGIYNIDGTKNYDINFGTLQLLVARQFEPMAGDPLDFRIEISSNTFKDVSLPVQIQEADYYLKFDQPMLDLTNLPTGIGSSSNSGSIGSNGQLNQPIVINTGSPDSLSKLSLTVPSDINFLDADGNTISGTSLTTDILSLSDTSESSFAAYPNGGGLIQPAMVNGELIDVALEPTSTFEINMNVDGQKVTNFSGSGIGIKVDIPADIYNEDANRLYQAGDSISLISYSDGNVGWVDDGTYLIQSDGQGNMFIDAQTTHLSYFKITGKPFRDGRSSRFRVISKLAPGNTQPISGNIIYQVKINRPGRRNRTIYVLSGGNTITSSRPSTSIWVYVARGNASISARDRGTVNNSNYNFSFSEDVPGDVVAEISPKNPGVNVSFSLYCAGNNAVVNPPPGVKMYYRETGTNDPFTWLYTFTEANNSTNSATIYELQDGTSYDFRALFNSHQVDTANVLVENNKHYQVTLPQSACNEIF